MISDVEEACRSGCAVESSAGRRGDGREIEPLGDVSAELHHTDLEIDIPAPVHGEGEVEGRGSLSGGGRRIGENDCRRRMDSLGLEGTSRR